MYGLRVGILTLRTNARKSRSTTRHTKCLMFRLILIFLGCLLALGCGDDSETAEPVESQSFSWDFLPDGFPAPRVPEDNPMTLEKIELGRHLFYDERLSQNQTQSCASCHFQEMAFTDGLAKSVGSEGAETPRSSMSLANVAYPTTLTWAGPLTKSLEDQMLTPLFADDPVELGLRSTDEMVGRLRDDESYRDMFAEAYPEAAGDDDLINLDRTTKAIAAFERRLISYRSPYDRYEFGGEKDAISDSAKRGKELFFGERFECFHCHGGFNFSDSVEHDGTVFEEVQFHNNGLYNVDGFGAYPEGNQGVFEITGVLEDQGRFRAPTLRNIALTAPYMHDGSIETLEEVLDHYARGGRLIEEGSNAGDGKTNPNKSELIVGFDMTEQERDDVIAFLESLTDEEFINDPAFAAPAD